MRETERGLTLFEALAESIVTQSGNRGARLGKLEATQSRKGKITLSRTVELKGGYLFEGPVPELDLVIDRRGWHPWGWSWKRWQESMEREDDDGDDDRAGA